MFYDFILKIIICKSLIFIKTISTPKTISKALIFLILIYQLLLIKLNFKIYLTRVVARRKVASARSGQRRPAKARRAGARRRPPRCGRGAAARTGRGGRAAARGNRGGFRGGLTAGPTGGRYLPPVHPAVSSRYRRLVWR